MDCTLAKVLEPVAAAQFCASNCPIQPAQCLGICSDPDLAGIGVRTGFYLQAATNVFLVLISPNDSAQGAWSGSILTAALVIPALVQKKTGNLGLHDATIVLNFATMSCISSLAVAPLCAVWQPGNALKSSATSSVTSTNVLPTGSGSIHLNALGLNTGSSSQPLSMSPDAVQQSLEAETGYPPNVTPSSNAFTQSTIDRQLSLYPPPGHTHIHRSRLILSISLLIQISLQWAFAITLFSSPMYSQPWCSRQTLLMLFLVPARLDEIVGSTEFRDSDHPPYSFAIWPLWILFCLLITGSYGLLLVLRSTEFADQEKFLSRASTLNPTQARSKTWKLFRIPTYGPTLPPTSTIRRRSQIMPGVKRRLNALVALIQYVLRSSRGFGKELLPPLDTDDKDFYVRLRIWSGNFIASLSCVIFVVSSEIQIRLNCIVNRGTPWGFGQMAAILLALAPGWAVAEAVYRYPDTRKKQQKLQKKLKKQRLGEWRTAAAFAATMAHPNSSPETSTSPLTPESAPPPRPPRRFLAFSRRRTTTHHRREGSDVALLGTSFSVQSGTTAYGQYPTQSLVSPIPDPPLLGIDDRSPHRLILLQNLPPNDPNVSGEFSREQDGNTSEDIGHGVSPIVSPFPIPSTSGGRGRVHESEVQSQDLAYEMTVFAPGVS